MIYKVKHFSLNEFVCPCCGRVKAATALIFWLDVLRAAIGAPLVINSGYRCPAHNASSRVNGAATSRHMIGCAADIARPKDILYSDFCNTARRVSGEGFEVVVYPSCSYIHFGVPRAEEKYLWNGREMLNL